MRINRTTIRIYAHLLIIHYSCGKRTNPKTKSAARAVYNEPKNALRKKIFIGTLFPRKKNTNRVATALQNEMIYKIIKRTRLLSMDISLLSLIISKLNKANKSVFTPKELGAKISLVIPAHTLKITAHFSWKVRLKQNTLIKKRSGFTPKILK